MKEKSISLSMATLPNIGSNFSPPIVRQVCEYYEYIKLLELQNLRKESLKINQSLKANPYWSYYSIIEEENILNPVNGLKEDIYKALITYSKHFIDYRKKLEGKYKFEFPEECYKDITFAEYFKDNFKIE